MKHSEQAITYHDYYGYNCAQAVVLSYQDLLDIDATTLFKLSECFGLGSGTMQGICGAVNGAMMIIGYLISNGNLDDGIKTKATTYKWCREYQKRFEQKNKALHCKALKDPKLDSFTPCNTCIIDACDILDELLTEINQ